MPDQSLEEAGYKPSGRVYPKALAAAIGRTVHTIRCWERDGVLPRNAMPKRDSRGWRYWTPAQVDVVVRWVESRRRQDDEKLNKLRAERYIDSDPQECPRCGGSFKDLDRHVRMKHGRVSTVRAVTPIR